ncbi:hypothetical protein GW17_00007925, partial [Ensete ventricosum]
CALLTRGLLARRIVRGEVSVRHRQPLRRSSLAAAVASHRLTPHVPPSHGLISSEHGGRGQRP